MVNILDTSIIIALFKDDDVIGKLVAQVRQIYVPVIALGELYFGAKHSPHVQRNLRQIRAFARKTTVLKCDAVTAENYAEIKSLLKTKGRPIPENDIWIAAIARQHSLVVATRDKHFSEIDSLKLAIW